MFFTVFSLFTMKSRSGRQYEIPTLKKINKGDSSIKAEGLLTVLAVECVSYGQLPALAERRVEFPLPALPVFLFIVAKQQSRLRGCKYDVILKIHVYVSFF